MTRFDLPHRPYTGATPANGGRRVPRVGADLSGRAWYSVIGGTFSIGPVWADEEAARAIFLTKTRTDPGGPSTLYTFQGGVWSVVPT